MKRFITLATLLLMTFGAFAQQALWGGQRIVSPEINADNSVTFRFVAPKAIKVQVTGDFLPTQKIEYERDGRKMSFDAPGVADLKEGAGGHVWRNWRDYLVDFAPRLFRK